MISFALILAFVWGIIWACFIQFVPFGRFLAKKRTYLTVVIGVGVDLLIALLVIPWEFWWRMGVIITLSSLAIIVRSWINEWGELREFLNGKDKGAQQSDLGARGHYSDLQ